MVRYYLLVYKPISQKSRVAGLFQNARCFCIPIVRSNKSIRSLRDEPGISAVNIFRGYIDIVWRVEKYRRVILRDCFLKFVELRFLALFVRALSNGFNERVRFFIIIKTQILFRRKTLRRMPEREQVVALGKHISEKQCLVIAIFYRVVHNAVYRAYRKIHFYAYFFPCGLK